MQLDGRLGRRTRTDLQDMTPPPCVDAAGQIQSGALTEHDLPEALPAFLSDPIDRPFFAPPEESEGLAPFEFRSGLEPGRIENTERSRGGHFAGPQDVPCDPPQEVVLPASLIGKKHQVGRHFRVELVP